MVELPTDESRDLADQFLFPHEELWVPVSVVNRNIHILPGVPLLCKLKYESKNRQGPNTHCSCRLMVS